MGVRFIEELNGGGRNKFMSYTMGGHGLSFEARTIQAELRKELAAYKKATDDTIEFLAKELANYMQHTNKAVDYVNQFSKDLTMVEESTTTHREQIAMLQTRLVELDGRTKPGPALSSDAAFAEARKGLTSAMQKIRARVEADRARVEADKARNETRE